VTLDDQQEVYVEVARRADALVDRQGESRAVSVGGRPATAIIAVGVDAVRWQPVPGLWAQAFGTADIQTEIGIAETLDLSHVYRCAVPFRLTLSGGRLNKCETTFSAVTGTAGGGVWVVPAGSSSEYQVSVGDSDQSPVNEVVAGHAMAVHIPVSISGRTLAEIKYPYFGRMAYFWVDYSAADAAVLRSIAAGFKPALTGDPAGWPRPPFT